MSPYSDLKGLIDAGLNSLDLLGKYQVVGFWNRNGNSSSKRYIVAKKNGGPSDEDVEASDFTIWFLSAENDADMPGFNDEIEEISKYLSTFYSNECVFGLNVLSSVSGPAQADDGRYWSAMNLQVLYSNSQ